MLKQSIQRHVWNFLKKCENAVSAIQNVIIMPSLLSVRHEMDTNRSQCGPRGETTTWKNGDGLRKIRIKFSLTKKTILGVTYVLFHPPSKRKVFSPFKYRCFLMKFGEEMRSVINISRARDKEKIWIPDINWTYMTYRTPFGCSNYRATLDLWRAGPYTRLMFYMRPAYC